MSESQLLRVEKLLLHFRTARGPVQAVDRVNLDLNHTEAIVILGESGCGKTSLAKAILRLLPLNVDAYSGQVYLNGTEVMGLEDEQRAGPLGAGEHRHPVTVRREGEVAAMIAADRQMLGDQVPVADGLAAGQVAV